MDIDLPYILFWAVLVSGTIIVGYKLSVAFGLGNAASMQQDEEPSVPAVVEFAQSFFPVCFCHLVGGRAEQKRPY